MGPEDFARYPVICVTHNDLDGAGCAIVMNSVNRRVSVLSISSSEIEDTLRIIIHTLDINQEPTIVSISDLSFDDDETMRAITYLADHPFCKLLLFFDHHLSTLNQKLSVGENLKWIFHLKISATEIMHEYFVDRGHLPSGTTDLFKFVSAVTAMDLWQEENRNFEVGQNLGFLFEIKGFDYIVKRGPSAYLDPIEKTVVFPERFRQLKIAAQAASRAVVVLGVAVLTLEDFSVRNLIPAAIEDIFGETDIVVSINGASVSLRTSRTTPYAHLIAKSIFFGGGHAHAAGGSLTYQDQQLVEAGELEKLATKISNVIGDIKNGVL